MVKMVKFDGVYVRSRNNYILQEVSFYIREKEKVVFYGKSGSGKSCILKTMVGGFIPEKGTVFFCGKPVCAKNVSEIRQEIAYIAQEPVLGAKTVREALFLPFAFKAHRNSVPSEEHVNNLLRRFNLLPTILNQNTASLSGGEKQRIAIARAVLLNKTVFIADEITSALDSESKKTIIEFLMSPENTIISASHDPDWISRCNRVLSVEEGRVKEDTRYAND
jgi:putative ABC transport system ATP-binding protein